MAERQSEHRQKLEAAVVSESCNAQKRGQILGFILALVVICGGFALIWNGKDAIGLSAIISSLVSLVAVFMYGRRQQKKELSDKASAFGPQPTT